MSINEIAQSYEGGDIVPIYTAEQLEKVGTGETAYVAETGKIYTFEDDKSYLFYGQSEDLTKILNDLIDEKLGTSSGTTTGIKTLLWEREIPKSDDSVGTIEEKINIENLSKYKRLFIEVILDDSGTMYEYLDIKDIKESMNNFVIAICNLMNITGIKYINETTLYITSSAMMYDGNIALKVYGIE